MDWLGISHFATAITALVSGAVVVFRRKGNRAHRMVGRVYLVSMVALNVTALLIYDLWGHFGPFHVAAIFSLITVVMGFRAVRLRRGQWMVTHAYWMSWSYVGLLAAAVSESATRYLRMDFGWTVAVASFVVIGIGAMVINRWVPRILGSQ